MITLVVGQKTTLTATLLNATPTAQVDNFTINAPIPIGHIYHFTINGTLIQYQAQPGDVASSISTGLLLALSTAFPTNSPVNAAGGGGAFTANVILTGVVPGVPVLYTNVDPLLIQNTTPATGIVGGVDPGFIQWTTDDPTVVAVTPSQITSTSPGAPNPIPTGFSITIFAIAIGTINVTATYNNQGLIILGVTQVQVVANNATAMAVVQGPVT
jgi:hypothetical protein